MKDGEGKDSFYQQLTEMNKKLMFCKSFEEIEHVVNKLVLEISKQSLQLSDTKRIISNIEKVIKVDTYSIPN